MSRWCSGPSRIPKRARIITDDDYRPYSPLYISLRTLHILLTPPCPLTAAPPPRDTSSPAVLSAGPDPVAPLKPYARATRTWRDLGYHYILLVLSPLTIMWCFNHHHPHPPPPRRRRRCPWHFYAPSKAR